MPPTPSVDDLRERLEVRTRELNEALEQRAATAQVLRIISKFPGEPEPVFRAILDNATRICAAHYGALFKYEDGEIELLALRNAPEALEKHLHERGRIKPRSGSIMERIVTTKDVVHVEDLRDDPDGPSNPASKYGGARTYLGVPMLKDGAVTGAVLIYKQEVKPFTKTQIELVQEFANQAVIAIENARLLNELRRRTDDLTESLEQQTATSEVLKVISSSPGELEPIFKTMIENATRLCGAEVGTFALYDVNGFHGTAVWGHSEQYKDAVSRFHGIPGTGLALLEETHQTAQVADVASEAAYDEIRRHNPDFARIRTALYVPIVKESTLIGAFLIYRHEVRPFTDKQIELVQHFADQAVIAIENARLLNELRQRTDDLTESLGQQTATSQVLQVISSSPGKLEPVFETILENAVRICGAEFGMLYLSQGDGFRTVAMHAVPPAFAEKRGRGPLVIPPAGDSPLGRVMRTRQVAHVVDIRTESGYAKSQAFIDLAELGGARTVVAVPMLKDNDLAGTIVIYRQEVHPFTDKQIELVKNFAAQAVIAIENARLLNELRQRTDDLSKSLENLRTTQDRLVQTEKLASLGQLTAGIAHEIKNPLNFVNNFSGVSVELIDELQATLGGMKADDKTVAEISELADTLRSNLDKIVQHGQRADAIVKNMLLHSRQGSAEHRPVDINALIEESLNLAYHGARAEQQGFNITLERSLDPAAGEADLFPQDITRVLLNLISNGFYAATKRKAQVDGGDYEPTLMAATRNLGDSVEIRIRDNGTGIPAEVMEQMFNPFFTTKPAGEGTGLGLSISHDIIVKQHGGSIEVDTQPDAYTEFRIILPRKAATLGEGGGPL